MIELKKYKIHICILIYLLLLCFLIFLNPEFCYDKNGNLKEFGTGQNKTITPLWIIILFIALISYYISNFIVIFK